MNYSNEKYVFADSSFFICFLGELKNKNCYNFLDYYQFAIGERVSKEITNHINPNISSKLLICNFDNYNYEKLFSPILSNLDKNKNKGEYEIIGLSLFYLKLNKVKYVVIDDNKAKKIAKNKFSELNPYITGTIGLIRYCSKDEYITPKEAIKILKDIINIIETYEDDENKFPCSLGKNYQKIIYPVIESLGGNING